MYRYRVRLSLRSGIATPLRADTLWGHLAWGIRYTHGEQALVEWLQQYDSEQPPLVISDPFPAGYLPRPLLQSHTQHEKLDRQMLRRIKEFKSKQWVSEEQWGRLALELSVEQLKRSLDATNQPRPALKAAMMHASINRMTGGTQSEDGGMLYSTQTEYFEKPEEHFDVYCLSSATQDQVHALFINGLASGYGKDASSGLGQLEVGAITPWVPLEVESPNACIVLGRVSPQAGDPVHVVAGLETYSGRLGGEYAYQSTPDGGVRRQKHPVSLCSTGSVFAFSPSSSNRSWIGRTVRRVHPFESIRHYAMAPIVPCRYTASSEATR